MTPKEVRNKLVSKYLVEFNGQFPIAIVGQPFTKPSTPEPWVRIAIIMNDSNQTSLGEIGNRRYQKTGFTVIQIFTPINTGTDRNDEIAEDSLVLMDGIKIDPALWTYNGRIDTIGDNDDYYQQNVVVEFKFEDIR